VSQSLFIKDELMPSRSRSSWGWSSHKLPVFTTGAFSAVPRRLSWWAGDLLLLVVLVLGSVIILAVALAEPTAQPLETGAQRTFVNPLEGVAFSPDGKTLASCGWDGQTRIWDVSRLSERPPSEPVFLPHSSARFAVAFSPDGTLLAAAGDKSLAIWSCDSGHYTPILEEGIETSHCLAFSPDGRSLAIGGDDGSIHLWDMPGGHERAVLRGHNAAVRSLGFSADASRLLSTCEGRSIMLWDAISGTAIRPLQLGHEGTNRVLFGAFAGDGRHVAVGEVSSTSEDITVIDSETGEIRTRLSGHSAGINALAFSPDGRTLATAGQDCSIKLWDWADGKEMTTLRDGVGAVKSLAFSRDGQWLAFGGDDHSIRIWDVTRRRSLLVGRFPQPSSDAGVHTMCGPSPSLGTAVPNRGISG
jgi:WD40 repeat protein